MITTRLYRSGELQESDFEPALVSDYLGEPGSVVWMDLMDPGEADFSFLSEEFGLHPLAVEDATHPHQRPKIEKYENHRFIVLYAIRIGEDQPVLSEVDIFVGDNFIITVRKSPTWQIESALSRWDPIRLDKSGVGFLLYTILDSIVDEYFVVVDVMNDRIEQVEDALFETTPQTPVQEKLFEVRKDLVTIRRAVLPLREVMNELSRREQVIVSDEIQPYFQDVYDHTVRVAESVEGMRELLASALEVHLSVASNRLNEIMKRITSWAAILGVATTIAGIYGMNFKLVPRDQTLFGFWFAVGLIAVACASLWLYFRRKDWL